MSDATRISRAGRVMLLAIALTVAAPAGMAADSPAALRVCADPNNLPFSDNHFAGFENKIAQLIASDLNLPLEYTWHPERKGFIRETLKAGKCDVVIGVPSGYDLVLSTEPYYSSSYVFVYAKSKNLHLRSFDDPVLAKLKIGVHAFGDDGSDSPAVDALARRGIVNNIVGYTILATADSPPGRIVSAVAKGEIDVAIVWGPAVGYFAQHQPVDLDVVPVAPGAPAAGQPQVPFAFDISMGVRRGDTAFKKQLEGVMDRRREDVRKILESYGVPLVAAVGPPLESATRQK